MGIEMATFLVFMTENTPHSSSTSSQTSYRPYLSTGHYTKDEVQNLLLIGSLLQILGERNLPYLKPTQYKLCQKVAYRFLNLYKKSQTIGDIFEKMI